MNKFKCQVLGLLVVMFLGSVSLSFASVNGVTFDMGTEVSHFTYKEPGVMEETGALLGVYMDVILRQDKANKGAESWQDLRGAFLANSMLALESKLSLGQLSYTSTSTGTLDGIDELMLELRGLGGVDLAVFDATRLTPYVGLGYRLLDDNTGGMISSTGHYGYDRESHYVYLPLGVKSMTDLNDQWQVGFDVEFDFFLFGKQQSHLEQVNASLNTLKNDQDSGYGVRGGLKFVRTSENYILTFEPFVRFWDVDESNSGVVTCGGTPCASGYEPKNESIEYGLRVGTRF
ncbi:hypothetical protein ACFL49_01255 [Candidatus Omnitrophota bacterium]